MSQFTKFVKTSTTMKVTITSIELKTIFKFFPLSRYALDIIRQLNTTDCLEMKKQGLGKLHYTMTLWENEAQLKAFARSGAHRDAMKKSATIAKAIKTLTIEAEQLPDWKTAKKMLEKVEPIRYN